MENQLFLENLERRKKSIGIIHRVYLTQVKNARVITASTKTKSEVRGGGRKPWRQKGTGNARAGSTRSPLFVGGGVIFGPKPRTCSKKINKKERRLAILSALYLKKKQFLFVEDSMLDTIDFSNIKTKNIISFLNNIGLKINFGDTKKKPNILFLLPTLNNTISSQKVNIAKNMWLSARNIQNFDVTSVNCLNLQQLLKSDHILLSASSLETINQTYGKQYI